jgi:FkbH-like protein
MAFRDAVIEATLRLQGVPVLASTLRRCIGTTRLDQWQSMYDARCARHGRASQRITMHRAPRGLKLTALPLRRTLVVGSCLSQRWGDVFQAASGCACDYVLINHIAELPAGPPCAADEYDFQVVQIPLRTLLPENSYFHLPYADIEAHRRLFEDIRGRLPHYLASMMRWNKQHGLLTFVANFFVPQQNPMGRLMPRQDLRNPVFMVEQINALLADELQRYDNAYLLDIDQIAATLGKAFIQDDSLTLLSHNSTLDPAFWATDAVPSGTAPYMLPGDRFAATIWAEIVAMHRTLLQLDAVKLVTVDLDDTIWRGVAAEGNSDGIYDRMEGWPIGMIEALKFLKKRGMLLAIVSKNDETRIVQLWDQMMAGRLGLDDFVAGRINWRPKAENLEEIIREVNVLPRSVVFIDDNPVERAAVQAALPDVRVLGSEQLLVRSTLLWAPETQVATITDESEQRTEMVRAQIGREADRTRMSRDEFLASLGVRVRMIEITSVDHPKFNRAFELVNKTNQFNTTGERWTQADCQQTFARRGAFHAFEVEDRFTRYGIVGLAIVEGNTIVQFVMSCRVFGLDVERAVIAAVCRRLHGARGSKLVARLNETDANFPCRDLYARCGFAADGGHWTKPHAQPIEVPSHIALTHGG